MIRKSLLLLACLFTFTLCHADGVFPEHVGDWTLKGVRIYDDPGLGFSLRYQLPQSSDKFDIYFYNNGQTDLGTGLSEVVKREFATVFASINLMGRRGFYADISKPQFGQGTIDLTGETVPFLFGHVTYRQTEKGDAILGTQDPGLRQSFTFLTAYKGRFFKVRFTVLSDDYDPAFQRFNHIMAELERSFDKTPTAVLEKDEE